MRRSSVLKPVAAAFLALAIAGCSSMGGLAPASSSGAPRSINLVADDLSALVFALDLPDNVRPAASGPNFSYDVNDENAPPYLDTALVLGDADAVMAALPAPAAGRSYHIYVLSDPAREKIRAMQTFARNLPRAPLPTVVIVPRLCLAAPVDKASTTVTVRVVLPGRGALQPLIAAESLSALEARSATILNCA
jgi:hypothetical protein